MASTRIVFCLKELREKVEARIGLFLGLKSAHTDRLFVVNSCEKISERFYIGAKVSETHATDRLKLCVIYRYGNITYKAR